MTTIALGLGCGLALVALLHRPITVWTEHSLWSPVSLGSVSGRAGRGRLWCGADSRVARSDGDAYVRAPR